MADASVVTTVGSLLTLLVRESRFDADGLILTIRLDGPEARLSVRSLVDAADTSPPSTWPALVEAWCSAVLEQLRRPVPAIGPDDLRLLLAPRQPAEPTHALVRPVGAFFQLELMAELDDRRVWVRPSRLADIGLSAGDVWDAAVRNTEHELDALRPRPHRVTDGFEIVVVARDGCPWVASGLMTVPAWAGSDLPLGALVGIPSRSSVLYVPVRSAAVTTHAAVFHRLVAAMHDDACDPCVPGLFWLHGDALYPVTVDGDAHVTFPVELRGLVESLPPAT